MCFLDLLLFLHLLLLLGRLSFPCLHLLLLDFDLRLLERFRHLLLLVGRLSFPCLHLLLREDLIFSFPVQCGIYYNLKKKIFFIKMCQTCEDPNKIECVDNRCILTIGCKYLEKCMNKLSEGIYKGMSCACNYQENGAQVFQIPNCVVPTESPTISPSMSPTLAPTNSSVFGMSDIEAAAKDNVEDYITFFIVGGVAIILLVLLYFRRRLRPCLDCFTCNKVEDDDV